MVALIVLGIVLGFILISIGLPFLACKMVDFIFNLREKNIYKKYPELKKLQQELENKQSIYFYKYDKVWLPIRNKIDDILINYKYTPLYLRKEIDFELERLREDYVRASADMTNAKAEMDMIDNEVQQFQKKHNIKW